MIDWKAQAILALVAVGSTLLMGKTFKTLLLWPFHAFTKWTTNKKDDVLIGIAEADLGVEKEVAKLHSEEK